MFKCFLINNIVLRLFDKKTEDNMISDDFDLALFVVADITEINPEEILSTSKRMEVVEARVLLYKAMIDWGYHPAQIATKVRKEKSGIVALLDTFQERERSNPIFRRLYKEISKKLMGE